MVTVVQVPPTPKSGAGAGAGGIATLISMAIRSGQRKRMSVEIQDYIDQLEKVRAQGGQRKDADDIQLPQALKGSSQGISTAMQIQQSIFGPTSEDKTTGFFTKSGEFIGDFPRSQRPKGGLMRQELGTITERRKETKATEPEKIANIMLNRVLTRRKNEGLKTSPETKAGIRGGIRIWNKRLPDTNKYFEAAYGKADPNDPNRFIYDSPESRKLGNKARDIAFEHFISDPENPPTYNEALAFGVETAGPRVKQPEPPAPKKEGSALDKILQRFLGGVDEKNSEAPPAAPPAEMRNIGRVGETSIDVPTTIQSAPDTYKYIKDTYKLEDQEVFDVMKKSLAQ